MAIDVVYACAGLMAIKHNVSITVHEQSLPKDIGKLPAIVKLESALDTALDTSRWAHSEQRRTMLASSQAAHQIDSVIEDVVSRPSAADLVDKRDIEQARKIRLNSVQLPMRPDRVRAPSPVMLPVSPVSRQTRLAELKSPSPVRISHRHSGMSLIVVIALAECS